jgi:aspartyl-tRNA synthetase
MIAGFEKYFQIARCYRDEDGRSDRQPEFTQIDIEMSFITEAEIMNIIEGLIFKLFKKFRNFEVILPIERMTYKNAMEEYGSDKPGIFYFNLKIQHLDLK